MIAQYEDSVREMYNRSGLEIERVVRGHWKGGFPGSGQTGSSRPAASAPIHDAGRVGALSCPHPG